jgi:hypothetical protein
MASVVGRARQDVGDKFVARFELPEDPNDCWEWTGHKEKHGYGMLRVKNAEVDGNLRAHVLALDLAGIRKPGGDYVVHHICGNEGCVNPDHLEWKTRSQHQLDHLGATCKYGHPRTPEHTYYRDGRPYHCKSCQKHRYLERKGI